MSLVDDLGSESQFNALSVDQLQKCLNEEKCLEKRRVIRKVMRSKSSVTHAADQTDSTRRATFAAAPEMAGPVARSSVEPALVSEADHLAEELRHCTSLEKRKQLRKQLQELAHKPPAAPLLDTQSNGPNITILANPTPDHVSVQPGHAYPANQSAQRSPVVLTNNKEDVVKNKILQPKILSPEITQSPSSMACLTMNHNEDPIPVNTVSPVKNTFMFSNQSHQSQLKSANQSPIKSSPSPIINHSQRIISASAPHTPAAASASPSTREDAQKTKDRRPLSQAPTVEVSIPEGELVQLRCDVTAGCVDGRWPRVAWWFNNRKMSEYPGYKFPSLATSTSDGSLKTGGFLQLQFGRANKREHEGRFFVEVEDGPVTLFCEFVLSVTSASSRQTASPAASSSSATCGQSPVSTVFSQSEQSKNINQSHSDRKINKPEPSLKVNQPDSTNRISQSVTSSSSTVPVQPISSHKTVSRIASMKEMFEKPASGAAEKSMPSSVSRHGSVLIKSQTSPLASPLDAVPKSAPFTPLHTATPAHPVTGGASLDLPYQPQRKTSQTGIITVIPRLVGKARAARSNIQAMKETILEFCKSNTREYENVKVTNYSGSWANGLAFCALIHHFYPDSFDYSLLSASNALRNFHLAFDTAQRLAAVEPLLDPDDMIILETPDWKCVYTYLQSLYKTLKSHPRNLLQTQPVSSPE